MKAGFDRRPVDAVLPRGSVVREAAFELFALTVGHRYVSGVDFA